MISVRNLQIFPRHKFMLVDKYVSKTIIQIWNCPDDVISKNFCSIGVWKIKQLKK